MAELKHSMGEPVWHRLARDMRREGYSVQQIAEEFCCDFYEADEIVDGIKINRSERMKRLNADPEFAKRHSERGRERMKRLHADPEFAKRNSERMKRLAARATPECGGDA